MGKLRDATVVQAAHLHDMIDQFRTLGYVEVARDFEELTHQARRDSQDLPPEVIRVQRDLLLTTLGGFLVKGNAIGSQAVYTLASFLEIRLDEDDLAFIKDATRRVRWAQARVQADLTPQATTQVTDYYWYLLTYGLTIAEGDLEAFCGDLHPEQALLEYRYVYARLQQAAAQGVLTLSYVYTPVQVYDFLQRALAASTLPDAFEDLNSNL